MKPNFEDPLDTAKQLVNKDITLYYGPHGQIFKQFLLQSPIKEYRILGEKFLISKDWDEYMSIAKDILMKKGTYAVMTYALGYRELAVGRWHRSMDNVNGHYPYGGYLTNKKWHLNEVI